VIRTRSAGTGEHMRDTMREYRMGRWAIGILLVLAGFGAFALGITWLGAVLLVLGAALTLSTKLGGVGAASAG
jgi:hypothetical protein